jgi:hypothetical protein
MTSPPSGGSVNPPSSSTSGSPATSRYIWFDHFPPMLRSQPVSSQEPLNPLGSSTSGSPATRYIWIDPIPPMWRGLPASTQEPLNPLTSASRGLPVGQYANAMAYAKSRPPANQVPAMQVLPMQQLNTGTLIGN